MRNALLTLAEASDLIASGKPLAIAGDETCLAQLPRGAWIGGTIPYFMTGEGGLKSQDKVFVTVLPEAGGVRFDHVPAGELARLVSEAPENGFAVVIIPASSPAHARFAQDCRGYPDAFLKPTVGWIAGVALDAIGRQVPKVFEGTTGRCHEDGAVVAHVTLPEPRLASIEIVNMFEPDGTDRIEFTEGGFSVVRNQIVLDNPIKSVGMHEVKVQLHPEVRSKVTLNVARNADEAERQARGEDVTIAQDDEEAPEAAELLEVAAVEAEA